MVQALDHNLGDVPGLMVITRNASAKKDATSGSGELALQLMSQVNRLEGIKVRFDHCSLIGSARPVE
jgi:hypothetical protein